MTKYFDYTDVEAVVEEPHVLGDRVLKKGIVGEDVKELQEKLIALGFDCGSYGADGDFGKDTKSAVVAFQERYHLTADGVVNEETVAKINGLMEPDKIIVVTGGSVNVRSGASTDTKILGVVHKGELLTYAGSETDNWFNVMYKGSSAWISKKYSENG